MPPTALFTVITPSASVQVAGDLSLISTHSSMLVPLNSTTASDGGAPLAPGLTMAGTGVHCSVSSGRVGTRAPAAPAAAVVVAGAGALCGAACGPEQAARPTTPNTESESNDSRVDIAGNRLGG